MRKLRRELEWLRDTSNEAEHRQYFSDLLDALDSAVMDYEQQIETAKNLVLCHSE